MGTGPSKEELDNKKAVNKDNEDNKLAIIKEEKSNAKELAKLIADTKEKEIEAQKEESKRNHELSKLDLEKKLENEAKKEANFNEREKEKIWLQFTSDIIKVILLFIVTMTFIILTCSKLGVVQYRTETFEDWSQPENWYDSESWTYEVPQKLKKWLEIESLTSNSQPSESGKFAESLKIERSNADPGSWTHDSEGWEHETESEGWTQESESEGWTQDTWSWYTHPFYWLTRNVIILAIFTLVVRWSLVLILQNI